jgi:membrane-bound serine protease (ClpP class)
MTALGVSLLVIGTIMIVVEAHVSTLGALGVPGVIALAAGAILAVSGLGGGIVVGVLLALVLSVVSAGVLAVTVRKGLSARRQRIAVGAESLVGHLGVVRSWTGGGDGKVLVDGALWSARRSPCLDDEDGDAGELHAGDQIVVERLSGLTLSVRRAEEWEVTL